MPRSISHSRTLSQHVQGRIRKPKVQNEFKAPLDNEIYTNLQDEINVLKDKISSFEHRVSIFINPKGVRMSHDYRDLDQRLEMKTLDDQISKLRIKI